MMSRPHSLAPVLAMILVATACSSKEPAASTSVAGTTAATTSSIDPRVAMPTFPDDADVIGADPNVTIGRLDNGLTYYIRRNTRPGTRAQLRLAVAAGSALEDDDQRGVAHYLEHMMFNGTESFPANELIRVLERFGSEFGPDINAYTSFDQTVYELEVPTDAPGTVETALDVLYEWSAKATIAPGEVEAERGVLLEEWRLRSQNFFGRYYEVVSDVLLAGSPYAGHDPLADEAELAATTAATLRRFYEDWYRPDLMAVVAVGDFEVAEVEQLIRDRFSMLEMPPDPRPRPALETSPAPEPTFVVLADPESPNAFIELNYPLPALAQGTVGTARRELALELAFDMLVTRLDEDSRSSDAAFFSPSHAANPFVDGQRTPGLAAFAEPADLVATARALLEEVRRAVVHGFGADELARAAADARGRVDLAFEGLSSKQDAEYAGEYVAHFLTGFPIPEARDGRDRAVRLLEELAPGDVAAIFRATMLSTHPLVIAGGPESAAGEIPGAGELLSVVTAAAAADLEPRADAVAATDELMAAPEPAAIVSRRGLAPLAPTVLELANGARVAYVESDIAADSISFQATSPGGWLLLAPEDAAEAQLIGAIVAESGVGDLDGVSLSRFLSGAVVDVVAFIDESSEGMVGGAGSDDLELLFQLIHLYFTRPRADQRALDALLGELRPLAAERGALPALALADRLQQTRYDGDDRYLAIPPLSDLEGFDLAAALEVYRNRFADASDFVFAFAGDFEAAELEELAQRYLGTLPASGEPETAGTGQPSPPAGVVRAVVGAGDGALGAITYEFTTQLTLSEDVRLTVPLLESVLDQRLTAQLREALGATYSPLVAFTIQEDPVELIDVQIQVSADPGGLQRVADAIEADAADLAAEGPTADEFAIAREQTLRNYELIGNQFWLDTMTRLVLDPGLDPGEVARRAATTRTLTASDVRALARLLLTLDNYIRIDLVPAAS